MPERIKKTDTTWMTWLKIIGTVVGIAGGIIGTTISVRQCSKSSTPGPSADVVATVSSGRFRLPFISDERFREMSDPKKLQNEIENSEVLSAIKDKNMRERIMAELSKRISDYMWNQKYYVLQGAIGPGLEAAKLARLDVYWDIVLENKGSMVAKNVRLKLPSLAYVRMSRDKNGDNSIYSSLIELDELQPLEKVSIEAWRTSTFAKEEFRLTHAGGVGLIIQK